MYLGTCPTQHFLFFFTIFIWWKWIVIPWWLIDVIHLEELEQSFNEVAMTNTHEKLLTVFKMFNINGNISSVEHFTKVPDSAILYARIFVESFEDRLYKSKA
jgi:hypothetical protein